MVFGRRRCQRSNGREFAPKDEEWNKKLTYWKTLFSDTDAKFDTEINIDAKDIEPMITYGTNPGMGIGVSKHIPALSEVDAKEKISYEKALQYMGLGW